MAEKLKNMMSAESWIPYTYAEHMLMVDVFAKIPDAEIAEPVTFTGISNGRRNTEKQASVYDAMMLEIMEEKNRRMQKYLLKHYVRSDGKPQKKDKRKSYKKELCYSCDPWHGWETVRKYREKEAEKADARDYALEQENNAEFVMWDHINFEIESERLRNLNDWLKYA